MKTRGAVVLTAAVCAAAAVAAHFFVAGSTSDQAPVRSVGWSLLGSDVDGRSIIALPEEGVQNCEWYESVVRRNVDGSFAVDLRIRDRRCPYDNLLDAHPLPLTISLPVTTHLTGRQIGGPRYRGIASWPAQIGWRYVSVEGLALKDAGEILKRNKIEMLGARADASPRYVVQQTPSPAVQRLVPSKRRNQNQSAQPYGSSGIRVTTAKP